MSPSFIDSRLTCCLDLIEERVWNFLMVLSIMLRFRFLNENDGSNLFLNSSKAFSFYLDLCLSSSLIYFFDLQILNPILVFLLITLLWCYSSRPRKCWLFLRSVYPPIKLFLGSWFEDRSILHTLYFSYLRLIISTTS